MYVCVCVCALIGLGSCETEVPSSFAVQAVDEAGTRLATGGAEVTVQIEGNHRDTASGAVIDNVRSFVYCFFCRRSPWEIVQLNALFRMYMCVCVCVRVRACAWFLV